MSSLVVQELKGLLTNLDRMSCTADFALLPVAEAEKALRLPDSTAGSSLLEEKNPIAVDSMFSSRRKLTRQIYTRAFRAIGYVAQ